jgi:acetylornithine deacetylase/succinyl-diaminopimelate desuccinylase-like protein
MTNNLPTPSHSQLDEARVKVSELFPEALMNLKDLVKIPGIAWEAFDPENLEVSARAVAALLESTLVFDSVQILRSSFGDGKIGAPAVVARRAPKNNKNSILLYAHHDVQPPGGDEVWNTPAFEPTIKDGRMYGRGAADDKAGIVAHLSAIRAFRDLAGADFDLGITVFVEGEEEAGSPSFVSFLNEYKELLDSDVIVVADSVNWTTDIPALTTTLRGLVSLEFEVSTLDHAVHSGMYGGAVPDSMMAMLRILNSFWNKDGTVSIAGLHESESTSLSYTEDQLRVDSGLLPSTRAIGVGNILGRLWSKPALTVIGLDATTVAMSSNTLLPAIRAKVSLRIAPGENPETALNALKRHILANNDFSAVISFGEVELGKPFGTGDDGWAKPLAEQSLTLAFGNDSVDIGIGGSIPFIADLKALFPRAQILVTGVEDPDSRAHSPNESVNLAGLERAILAETLFLIGGNGMSK